MSIAASSSASHSPGAAAEPDDELAQVREALRGLKFGTVTIIVQDGVIMQIDRTEKRRVRHSAAR
jgi:hypothetical protein